MSGTDGRESRTGRCSQFPEIIRHRHVGTGPIPRCLDAPDLKVPHVVRFSKIDKGSQSDNVWEIITIRDRNDPYSMSGVQGVGAEKNETQSAHIDRHPVTR